MQGGSLGEDQHEGSNRSVLSDGADAGSGMQAEGLPQPACSASPWALLRSPTFQNIGVACTLVGFILLFWGFKPVIREPAPGSQHGSL